MFDWFSIELFDIFQKCTFIHLGIAPYCLMCLATFKPLSVKFVFRFRKKKRFAFCLNRSGHGMTESGSHWYD